MNPEERAEAAKKSVLASVFLTSYVILPHKFVFVFVFQAYLCICIIFRLHLLLTLLLSSKAGIYRQSLPQCADSLPLPVYNQLSSAAKVIFGLVFEFTPCISVLK